MHAKDVSRSDHRENDLDRIPSSSGHHRWLVEPAFSGCRGLHGSAGAANHDGFIIAVSVAVALLCERFRLPGRACTPYNRPFPYIAGKNPSVHTAGFS